MAIVLLWNSGCYSLHRKLVSPQNTSEINPQVKPILKAHLYNGEVWVYKEFQLDSLHSRVIGEASKFTALRVAIAPTTRFDTLDFSRVALFETNSAQLSSGFTALLVVGMAIGAFGLVCIVNPKACFGSCPTMYTWNGTEWKLQAESFSSSILPALEESDVDALYDVKPLNSEIVIRMKNEAYETHVLRYVDVLAVEHDATEQVYYSGTNEYIVGQNIHEVLNARAEEGDVRELLLKKDELERSSSADSLDLATKETIELDFLNSNHDPKALVLGFRQSLMSTYLFYRTLSYMGKNAGTHLAALQRSDNPGAMVQSIRRVLGDIDVEMYDGQRWKSCGQIFEAGPIAHNQMALLLPKNTNPLIKLRLRVAKGYWRINSAELVDVQRVARESNADSSVHRIHPQDISRGTVHYAALVEKMRTQSAPLVTVSGDAYDLHYTLPSSKSSKQFSYFVDAKGYYLEWIREQWMGEESDRKVAQLFLRPADYIQSETKAFKRVEADMEQTFWRSRVPAEP